MLRKKWKLNNISRIEINLCRIYCIQLYLKTCLGNANMAILLCMELVAICTVFSMISTNRREQKATNS